ncbi:MAG: FecR domain-containing protein [Candidatus Brocadiia bacterium]
MKDYFKDRFIDTLLKQEIGPEEAPDVREEVRRRFDGSRNKRRVLYATAAALMLVVGAALLFLRTGRYPESSVTGSYVLKEAESLKRGALVQATGGASISLGGYCKIEMNEGTMLRLEGEPHREQVFLHKGSITCTVRPERGRFSVGFETGRIRVIGTRFRVTALGPEGTKSSTRVQVRVIKGRIAVTGTWGQRVLTAGRETQFPPSDEKEKERTGDQEQPKTNGPGRENGIPDSARRQEPDQQTTPEGPVRDQPDRTADNQDSGQVRESPEKETTVGESPKPERSKTEAARSERDGAAGRDEKPKREAPNNIHRTAARCQEALEVLAAHLPKPQRSGVRDAAQEVMLAEQELQMRLKLAASENADEAIQMHFQHLEKLSRSLQRSLQRKRPAMAWQKAALMRATVQMAEKQLRREPEGQRREEAQRRLRSLLSRSATRMKQLLKTAPPELCHIPGFVSSGSTAESKDAPPFGKPPAERNNHGVKDHRKENEAAPNGIPSRKGSKEATGP